MEKKKTIINMDADMVLREIITPTLDMYKKHYNPESEVKLKDIVDYDMRNFLPGITSMKDELFVPYGKEIFYGAKPMEDDTIYLLNRLMRKNIVNIVTFQFNDANKLHTLAWLHDYGVNPCRVYFVNSLAEKRDIKADILIDDCIDNLLNVEDVGQLGICYNQPYNKEWKGTRIKSLKDLGYLMR